MAYYLQYGTSNLYYSSNNSVQGLPTGVETLIGNSTRCGYAESVFTNFGYKFQQMKFLYVNGIYIYNVGYWLDGNNNVAAFVPAINGIGIFKHGQAAYIDDSTSEYGVKKCYMKRTTSGSSTGYLQCGSYNFDNGGDYILFTRQ